MFSPRPPIARRRFLLLSAATAGLAKSTTRAAGGMRYRPLGRTGLQVIWGAWHLRGAARRREGRKASSRSVRAALRDLDRAAGEAASA